MLETRYLLWAERKVDQIAASLSGVKPEREQALSNCEETLMNQLRRSRGSERALKSKSLGAKGSQLHQPNNWSWDVEGRASLRIAGDRPPPNLPQRQAQISKESASRQAPKPSSATAGYPKVPAFAERPFSRTGRDFEKMASRWRSLPRLSGRDTLLGTGPNRTSDSLPMGIRGLREMKSMAGKQHRSAGHLASLTSPDLSGRVSPRCSDSDVDEYDDFAEDGLSVSLHSAQGFCSCSFSLCCSSYFY